MHRCSSFRSLIKDTDDAGLALCPGSPMILYCLPFGLTPKMLLLPSFGHMHACRSMHSSTCPVSRQGQVRLTCLCLRPKSSSIFPAHKPCTFHHLSCTPVRSPFASHALMNAFTLAVTLVTPVTPVANINIFEAFFIHPHVHQHARSALCTLTLIVER